MPDLRETIAKIICSGMVVGSKREIGREGPTYYVKNDLEVADAILSVLKERGELGEWRPIGDPISIIAAIIDDVPLAEKIFDGLHEQGICLAPQPPREEG